MLSSGTGSTTAAIPNYTPPDISRSEEPEVEIEAEESKAMPVTASEVEE